MGKFTGWIGYTLSWTYLQFDSLNFGEKYFARYDRRHDISLVGIYKVNEQVTFSATWVFGSGNAITLPLASYAVDQHTPDQNNYNNFAYYPNSANDYGKKNSFRMAPYHRGDIGLQFHKKLKRCIRTFELSVYNIYNRKNPFFYYTQYDSRTNKNKLMQVSLFPVLPSVSWSYKF